MARLLCIRLRKDICYMHFGSDFLLYFVIDQSFFKYLANSGNIMSKFLHANSCKRYTTKDVLHHCVAKWVHFLITLN